MEHLKCVVKSFGQEIQFEPGLSLEHDGCLDADPKHFSGVTQPKLRPLSTELVVPTDAFDQYELDAPVVITFALKEFKVREHADVRRIWLTVIASGHYQSR